jgi:hypothetical protein
VGNEQTVGDRPLTDDEAMDLTHVREVHDVVDHLRRLLVAAAEAEEAGAARTDEQWPQAPPVLQSPPGR